MDFTTDYFKVTWPRKHLEVFAEKIQKLLDSRKDWTSPLFQEVMKRMKFTPVKDVPVDINKIEYEENVLAIVEEWKATVSLRETPLQKTLDEATNEGERAKGKAMKKGARVAVHVKKSRK